MFAMWGRTRRKAGCVSSPAHEHARACRGARICEVAQFVAIPSVSGDAARRRAIGAAAAWLRRRLARAGLRVMPSPRCPGAPIVRAAWYRRQEAPTVLIYGHYDVQPAEPTGWRSDPFTPVIRGNRLYGRGATDDKGPVVALIGALESLLATSGRLPVNVECVFEGEEEIGSSALLRWLAGTPQLPRIDVAVIADTPARASGWPAVVHALRGSISGVVTVRGLDRDVHAGVYGGGVPDAARELTRLLATLHDSSGSIAVRDLQTGIAPVSRRDLARVRAEGPGDGEIRAQTGARSLDPRSRATTAYERITLLPSITITSLAAGHQGATARNVIPASATARLDVRLAPHQDPHRCSAAIQRHLKANAPARLDTHIRVRPKGRPVLIDTDAPLLWAAARALSRAYGHPCALLRSGGAVPVAAVLQQSLGIPTLLLGTTPPESGMHAPNEYLHLPSFHATVQALIELAGAIPTVLGRAEATIA
jgi:acetylornithine deacetylase/succinyl-diaminopimelate desuccinylase-like protein